MDEETVNIEPLVVPKSFEQLGILVLDGSGSMREEALNRITKADSVAAAVKDFISRMKISMNKDNFSFAIVTFDTSASIHTDITDVENINDTDDFDPLKGHGGQTDIAVGLQEAKHLANKFLHNSSNLLPKSVVIILMSDGESKNENEAIRIAEELKRTPEITICSTFFSRKDESNAAAKQLLMQIANDAQKFKTVYEGATLRDFFIASIAAAPQKKIIEE